MTPLQLTLLGIAGGAIFAYLIFRARRAEDLRRSVAREREERVAHVVDRYGALARSLESTNLGGMLKAGVCGLLSHDEVEEALRRIEAEGLTPGVPGTYRDEMQGVDLLVFFRLLKERPDEARFDAGVRGLIKLAKAGPGA